MADESCPRQAHVRNAKPEELEIVCQIMFRAFADDPAHNYFGSVKSLEANLTDAKVQREKLRFAKFVPHLAKHVGGRITVAVIPTQDGKEKIGAAALWLPPNRRVVLWKVRTLIRAGVIPVIWGWGLNGLKRLGLEFLDKCHRGFVDGYKIKGIKESPDNSWYLNLIGTDPEHQGKGLMSLLIREAYAHAPNGTFTLEVARPTTRDRYAHLGFEVLREICIGKGKVDNLGYPASGENATGVPVYIMAKWPSTDKPKASPVQES